MAEEKAKAPEKAKPARLPRAERRCKVKGCQRPYRAKGYCRTHYRAWRRGDLPKPRYKRCKKEGCAKPMVRRGYCEEHAKKGAAAPAA
jgi:hypothetical protein